MANKVNEEGGTQKDWQVDHLIHEHQNQMEHLNDKLQETKERQEQILLEKLQAKKLKKERFVQLTGLNSNKKYVKIFIRICRVTNFENF